MDEIEAEVNRQIAAEPNEEAMHDTEQMNLEIPKWRTWGYSDAAAIAHQPIEDLREDAFIRRHARFLNDERKRKKWDVQRIREQRTIERLKRRHCKDELNDNREDDEIHSFFPSANSIKVIQITDDLPVSAFGEGIPQLQVNDFVLPWQKTSPLAAMSSSSLYAPVSPYLHPLFDSAFTSFTTATPTLLNPMQSSDDTNHSSIVFISKRKVNRFRSLTSGGCGLTGFSTISSSMQMLAAPPVPPAILLSTSSPGKHRRTRHRHQ